MTWARGDLVFFTKSTAPQLAILATFPKSENPNHTVNKNNAHVKTPGTPKHLKLQMSRAAWVRPASLSEGQSVSLWLSSRLTQMSNVRTWASSKFWKQPGTTDALTWLQSTKSTKLDFTDLVFFCDIFQQLNVLQCKGII